MATLMAQNEQNLLARIEELAQKSDEQARESSDRLDRLEERLHIGHASGEAAAQTSELGATCSAQEALGPAERITPQATAAVPEAVDRPPIATATEGLTRETLLEWERRLNRKERELEKERRELQLNPLGLASSLAHADPGPNARDFYRRPQQNAYIPDTARRPTIVSAPPILSGEPFNDSVRRAPTVVHPERTTPDFIRRVPTSESDHTISYVISSRDNVPHFKGEISACDPLKRNQEIESWIRSIENLVRPPTGDAFIRAARANCRGRAETMINSETFDHITDWALFKRELRRKFRGTYTAADFYKVLYDHTMTETQAPMDFYLQIEASVYQGFRDHREAIGDPSELIRRVFLSGIPGWLRDFLALKDDCTSQQLAETAQRVWNSRNGIKHGHLTNRHQSPNPLPEEYHPRRHFGGQSLRTRDPYSLHPVTVNSPSTSIPLASPPRRTQSGLWCDFHQSTTHSTNECRAIAISRSPTQTGPYTCFRCGQNGHLARECRFPRRQGDRAPSPTGRIERSQPFPGYRDPIESNAAECTREGRTTSRGTQC
ncbi:uncharacterized protein LOC122267671 [Penaeus japonicus]|uniref:uncharacterized protein LOC122267671 n=1 Tax=Penaeus japonicus TaxID=27405 RepID=UPI001C70BF56|nr:uncharacterized protein LOC122267671 [Penaeus japonicus]